MSIRADLNERDQRFKDLRNAMEQKGLAAVIVAGHGSGFSRGYIRYFADVHMWEGDSLILIPLDGEPMHVQVTYASASMPDEMWIKDYRRAPEPQKEIVNAMKEKGLTKGKVGIAGLQKRITVGGYEAIKNAFSNVEFVNADRMVDQIRGIKSDLELEQLRSLWEMSQRAMDRFVEVIGPGITQREAASEAARVFRGAGSFTDLTLIEEGRFKGLPRDVPLACDDMVSFHLEICGESGHWSEINVVCAYQEPSELERKLIDSEFRALQEVRAKARPGIMLKDLEDTFLQVIVNDGWKLGDPEWHYSFHGQGMDSIERPYFSPMIEGNEDAPLQEGMVFSYHPHRPTIPEVRRVPKIFDGFVITKDGAETLTKDWDFLWRIMK